MNGSDKNIEELIREIANDPAAEYYAKPCEVLTVDESARTCNVRPYDDTANVYGVRLQALKGSEKGLFLVPTVGSAVLVVFLSKSRAFVALGEQLDKIVIDTELTIWNGGEFGGIFKAPDTLVQLNKLKDRITQLENDLKTFANTQQAAAVGDAIPLGPGFATLATKINALPPKGEFNNDLIDDKIKH